MNFEFLCPTRIIFGENTWIQAFDILANKKARVFFVATKSVRRDTRFFEALDSRGLEWQAFEVSGEPDLQALEQGLTQARSFFPSAVIGIGGGSALDMAKALAILTPNTGAVLDYLEVIGLGKAFEVNRLDLILLPTTAGTGSEVTRNAVLASKVHGVKASLRSPLMYADFAIIDPSLALKVPVQASLWSGLDALVQLVEPFVSSASNPLVDALCRDGIPRVLRALPALAENPESVELRTELALAALYSGLALSNGKLGAVHGIAGPLGGATGVPHGLACAALVPWVVQKNIELLASSSPQRHKFDELAVLCGTNNLFDYLLGFCKQLGAASLGRWAPHASAIEGIALQAKKSSSMKGNPLELSVADIVGIIKNAC